MSQIWCNSAKLMTALLGMGREGMISVWSSIWSVPLAGCRRDAPLYASMLPIWHTHTHRYTYSKIIPMSPCWILDPVSLNTTTNILLNSLWCDTSHQNEHLLMGWMQVPPVVWLCSGQAVFISGCAVFQRKVGQPASNLENSEVTLWPFTRYALLQVWLELGISF